MEPGQALSGGRRSMADTQGWFSRGEVIPESDPGPQGRVGLCLGSSRSSPEVSFQVRPPGVPSRRVLQACPPGASSRCALQVCPPGMPPRCPLQAHPPGVPSRCVLQVSPSRCILQVCPPGMSSRCALQVPPPGVSSRCSTQKPCPWALPHQGRHNRKTTFPLLPGPWPKSCWQKQVEDEMGLAGCSPHMDRQDEPPGSVTLASGPEAPPGPQRLCL